MAAMAFRRHLGLALCAILDLRAENPDDPSSRRHDDHAGAHLLLQNVNLAEGWAAPRPEFAAPALQIPEMRKLGIHRVQHS